MPIISIIVPIYKVELYIRDCIDSILNQTFTDFELILVDDGSTDNCPAICDEYAKIDSRILVIHKKNGGLSSARNAGIDIAKGEYICFVDSDDIIHPQYCECLLAGIKQTNTPFCACKVKAFENELNSSFSSVLYSSVKTTIIEWYDYLRNNPMGVWNKIYNKRIFDNIRFKEGRIHEDIFFAADLLNILADKSVSFIDAPLYFARQRADSICNTQSNSKSYSADRIFAGEYLIQQSLTHDISIRQFCLKHAVLYPWSLVDSIYIKKNFKPNRPFLKKLQQLIKKYIEDYLKIDDISPIIKHRMFIFSYSRFLYGFNAYGRLLRVYLYRILKKDPYKDGHGI